MFKMSLVEMRFSLLFNDVGKYLCNFIFKHFLHFVSHTINFGIHKTKWRRPLLGIYFKKDTGRNK